MLQMGEYSARQQLKLSAMEAEVRENQAVTAQVNQLQAEKRCGTQCGSCLPTLRRLVATTPEEVPA